MPDFDSSFEFFGSGVSGSGIQTTYFTGAPDPDSVPLFCGTNLGLFASGIANDLMLGSGTAFSVAYISGWLDNHIGELNNSLQTTFNTVSGFAVPPMNYQEVAVYQEMFTNYYYLRNANNLLGASQFDWTSLQEADSRIVKVSRNELAKTFRGMAQDSQQKLYYMIAQYKLNVGQPLAVVGDDTIFAPYTDRYMYGGFADTIFPYYDWFFVRSSSF